jgi:hypothetical protein
MIDNHLVSWSILAAFLLFLIYTLIVVREEKQSFVDSAKSFAFKQFAFKIPSWWGLVEEKADLVRWKRLDTHYDWEAKLEWQDHLDSAISIEEDFKNRIETLQMVFDLDSSDILMPSDFKDRLEVKNGNLELVRIEGTATQDGVERCYLDAFLIRDHQRKQTLFATSLSSVLNGLVEGPYFEDMMLNLKWTPKDTEESVLVN